MKVLRLRMVNYRRHRDTQIEFPDGVTAIVGRNGSGKTTIIEAIAFALYGTPATRTHKALIRHDQAGAGDAVRVELEAEVAGQALAVVRELRGANQTGYASLTVDGQAIVAPQAGSSEAVTQEITRRIGLDREAFFNTVCAQQKELGRLAQKAKGDRKRLVLGMLGIDALDRAIQEAGVMRRTAEARVQALQQQVEAFADTERDAARAQSAAEAAGQASQAAAARWEAARGRLGDAERTMLQAKQQDLHRREVEARLERASREAQHLQATLGDLATRTQEARQAAERASDLAPAARDLEAARVTLEEALAAQHALQRRAEAAGRIARLRGELAAIDVPPAPNGALQAVSRELVQAQQKVERAQMQVTVLATEARGIQDRLRRVAGLEQAAACPVCDRPLDGHAGQLKQHLGDELRERETARARSQEDLDDARRRLAAIHAAVAQTEAAQRRHEEALASRRRVEDVLGRAIEDHDAITGPDAPIDIAAARARLATAQTAHTEHARLLALASGLPALLRRHDDLQRQLAEAQHAVEEAAAALGVLADVPLAQIEADHSHAVAAERQAERDHAAAQQAHAMASARLEAAMARLAQASAARQALEEALQSHREWQLLAGARGSGLLDQFRSHLVSRIGPAVAAEASRLLSRFTGGRYEEVLLDDDYEIYVTEEGRPYHLERFSGGESDLVHLALRLAVSRLLVERSGGAEIRFLALDEVFGSLDEQRRGLVLAALQELGTLYAQVLLVTHHEDMRDALDHALVVEEADGATVVRMHNG